MTLERIETLKDLKKVILASKDEKEAIKAGVLITEDELKRRVEENDSFPPFFMVKSGPDRYHVMKYENGELDVCTD
tara:strand:- start:9572 stop:9799 length:228 start_codon:yes stop_codon:yes gene_type:complete